jgi:hypothetical protein
VRRAPVVSLCAASALVLAALVPAAAAEPPGQPADRSPDVPVARAAVAQRTLDAVDAALTGEARSSQAEDAPAPSRDLTLLLRDLRVQLPALRGEDRERAEAWLARPTDGLNDPEGDGYRVPAQHVCNGGEPGAGTDFCIHWVESTDDAPPLADTDPANGIPDQVDRTRAVMTRVWAREVGDAGFKEPLRDAGAPDAGPNGALDLYLSNVGGQNLFGYCSSEPTPGAGRDYAAYCVLDDDFSRAQFPDHTPRENLQVTAAHEFFHAVQFAYDAFEDTWLMEGTATWMEDEVYDGVNDNRAYLRNSPLTRPDRSLDNGGGFHVYGSWLWWRYLTEQHGADRGTGIPTLVRRIWEEADDSVAARPGAYSLQATRRVLAGRGSSLTGSFADFGVANRHPRASYEEGRAYAAARLAGSARLSASERFERVTGLDHLATKTFAFTPGNGLARGGWRLRARVDAPAAKHRPVAQLTVVRSNGTSTTERLSLDRRGIGRAIVGFDSDRVRQVELTLSNAGQRFDCDRGTDFSCEGVSRSDGRAFAFQVRLRR